ncbi:hypothetical protein SAMD00079811_21140 [Scytonema sp. HK-05]|nr:hypothetical protein SAMD00079811_21140 [Scytonema sp. HK-05]
MMLMKYTEDTVFFVFSFERFNFCEAMNQSDTTTTQDRTE